MIWKQKSSVIIPSFRFTILEILGKPLKFVSNNVDHNIYSCVSLKEILRTRQKGGLKTFLTLQRLAQILLLWL